MSPGATYEKFAAYSQPGDVNEETWRCLDIKLLAGITSQFAGEHAINARIKQQRDLAMSTMRYMRGRQALFLVCEHYRVDASTVGVANFASLMALQWSDRDPAAFVRSWEQIAASLSGELMKETQLREIFFDQFRTSTNPVFFPFIREYEDEPDGHPKRSLEFLLSSVRTYVSRQRADRNRKEYRTQTRGALSLAATSVCAQWAQTRRGSVGIVTRLASMLTRHTWKGRGQVSALRKPVGRRTPRRMCPASGRPQVRHHGSVRTPICLLYLCSRQANEKAQDWAKQGKDRKHMPCSFFNSTPGCKFTEEECSNCTGFGPQKRKRSIGHGCPTC